MTASTRECHVGFREAASIRVINQLTKKGARVVAYDPMAIPNTKKQLVDLIEYSDSARSALKGADCAVIMTEWDQFRKLKPKDFQGLMKTPRVLDARRVYDPREFRELNYAAIGLGPASPQQG